MQPQSILIDLITIPPDRQRREFDPDAHQQLVNSIADGQLQNAPVVRQTEEGFVLVSGERRLRAFEEIFTLREGFAHNGAFYDAKSRFVPYVTMGQLNALEAEEAEYDENFRRKDLTWQEQALASQKLHRLRQAQAEANLEAQTAAGAEGVVWPFPPSAGDLAPKTSHTIADTALELHGRADGRYQNDVRKEIILASHLANPAIFKAKSPEEAWKLLKAQEQKEKNRELAEMVGKSLKASDHTLVHANALDYIPTLGPESVDVILTDPPYGMGAHDFGDGGRKLGGIEHDYNDSLADWRLLVGKLCPLLYSVAKKEAHAYVFCDFDRFPELKLGMESAGWYVFRTPLVVYKINSGRVPLPDRGPRRQYELVLYAIKGNRTVNSIMPDVIPSQADEQMQHGAQKPVAVYINLLSRSVRPGDVVADFFAGTGTIFPAAHTMQCRAIGCELEDSAYGMCIRRLQDIDAAKTKEALV